MCSHNGREPGPKGLVHVSKDVSRACNGSDTRHKYESWSAVNIQPHSWYIYWSMKVKSIVFNSTCLLSPNSSKDRELLNSWWTRTGTFTPERSPKIQPSTLLGDAGREPLLQSVPVMLTSLCQIIPYPLAPKPTTTLLTMLLHRNVKSSLIWSGTWLRVFIVDSNPGWIDPSRPCKSTSVLFGNSR